MKLLNPNTRTCPIFRTRRDAELTKAIYRRVPVLVDKGRKKTGNAWGIRFQTMFHQTNDAGKFRDAERLEGEGYTLRGNRWEKPGSPVMLPLYEAKMVQAYDHRAAGVRTDGSNWMRQGQTKPSTPVDHANPEFEVLPRNWIAEGEVEWPASGCFGFKDISSATNTRTMIAAWAPHAGYTNHFVLVHSDQSLRKRLCLLANLNSFAFDYVTRQKISNLHLNFFIVEQLPAFAPDRYDEPCPWDPSSTLETWISDRVLRLTCTSESMLPLADAAGFLAGTGFGDAYAGRLHKWNPRERAQLRAELDAAYFHLYGLDVDDVAYVLSTFRGIDRPSAGQAEEATTVDAIITRFGQFAG